MASMISVEEERLHLISSNRVEQLTAELALCLQRAPLADPLAPEVIIVPSMPMGRWLGLQLARISGINCNVEYPLPASWLWRLISSHIADAPQVDPLSRELAAWRVFALLEELCDSAPFAALNRYLKHDRQGIKRWQLAFRIADIFDRYQYYRPELIQRWSSGDGDDWQAILWRRLLGEVGSGRHRLAVITAFVERLEAGEIHGLPQRVSMFAVSTLPPLLLHLLQRIARWTELYLYHLTPTDQYWADLKGNKALARMRLEQPEAALYAETGHELLASWGRQGQVFQDLLCADGHLAALHATPYLRQWPPTLLGNLQRDLFEVRMPAREQAAADDSLEVHICHSPMRECQVLHDALLRRMNADPTLKPEDILVMVPEISRYAPYIEAVFSKDESRPFLPWNISEISLVEAHPVIGAFLQLLELPESRFALSEILSLLDVPEITARFRLDADKIEVIRTTLARLNVRWGIDGAHKAALGLPATVEHSWRQAEQRLMAGFAMGESVLWEQVAPLDIDSGDAAVVADFWALFDRLKQWRAQLAAAGRRTAQQWQELLNAMLEDLFCEQEETEGRLQLVRDALAELASQAGANRLTLDLVRSWLGRGLGERDINGRYFSGGVTFCGMRPMRSLPFRVICLLGMQDAAFPGREQRLEFDRMQLQPPHPADPQKGVMDRYLMLETLLCARDAIHISYVGRSIRDNSVCQPSVLVAELLDLLRRQYGEPLVARMIHTHPMQPFSPRNYRREASFDRYWCALANQISAGAASSERGAWPTRALATENPLADGVELARLTRFMCDPVKFFFNHTLSIYLAPDAESSDEEPFALDGLARWQVRQRLLDAMLGLTVADKAQLQAEGMLPHGQLADLIYDEQVRAVAPYRSALEEYRGRRPQARGVALAIAVDGRMVELTGQVERYVPGRGLLHVTPSKLAGNHAMPLWIAHLALCAAGELAGGERSVLLCEDQSIAFAPLPADDAGAILGQYLAAMAEGVRRPLPLFTKSSWEMATKGRVSPASWAGNSYQGVPGDCDCPYVRLVMREVDENPVESEAFAAWAERWYRPMLDAIAEER